jgi:hypothetical protein
MAHSGHDEGLGENQLGAFPCDLWSVWFNFGEFYFGSRGRAPLTLPAPTCSSCVSSVFGGKKSAARKPQQIRHHQDANGYPAHLVDIVAHTNAKRQHGHDDESEADPSERGEPNGYLLQGGTTLLLRAYAIA